jgi:hypothetical protein
VITCVAMRANRTVSTTTAQTPTDTYAGRSVTC